MMEPVLEEIAREKAGYLKIVRINASYSPVQSASHNVQGVPAYALYKGGNLAAQTAGAMPKQALLEWIFAGR